MSRNRELFPKQKYYFQGVCFGEEGDLQGCLLLKLPTATHPGNSDKHAKRAIFYDFLSFESLHTHFSTDKS